MSIQSSIRSYLKTDILDCLEIFDKNCPVFFSEDERSGLETWLDGQDSGTITYESSMADFFYVVLLDYNVVGCGGFYIQKGEAIARITWGMIHPDHQNKGYGRKLLEFGIRQVEYLFPNHTIKLDTSQHSFPFFEKLEFETKRVTKHAYKQGLYKYHMEHAPKLN
jgi:[ribosomal protein S18]-alanine N-acetyltransferase